LGVNKTSFPSCETIAADIGATPRTAERAVSDLLAAAWFHRTTERKNGPNHYAPNYERLKRQPDKDPTPTEMSDSDSGVVTSSPTKLSPQPDENVVGTPMNLSLSPRQNCRTNLSTELSNRTIQENHRESARANARDTHSDFSGLDSSRIPEIAKSKLTEGKPVKQRKTTLPVDCELYQEEVDYGATLGLSDQTVERSFEKWKDMRIAEGRIKTEEEWTADLRKWIANEIPDRNRDYVKLSNGTKVLRNDPRVVQHAAAEKQKADQLAWSRTPEGIAASRARDVANGFICHYSDGTCTRDYDVTGHIIVVVDAPELDYDSPF
jgi:hypothetical protein